MADFSVQLDTSEVEEFNRAMPREIFNATRSAIRTTTTWTEKELEKKSSEKTKIPLKAFKDHRVFSRKTDYVGNVWFGFSAMNARFLGKIEETLEGAFAGSYFFRGRGDHYFVAKLGNRGSGHRDYYDSGVQSIWTRLYNTRFPVTEGRANINNLESLADEIALAAGEELKDRCSKKLRAFIEKRESAA